MNDTELKPISSEELVNMLSNAMKIYGNRPVFVEINNRKYIVNDLEFSANGKVFALVFK